jgi:type II secretory pathway pseudopilin PulG
VKKNNKGFTFIELVLYMGILSVFMVAVTTLVGSTVASNRKMTARKKIQTQASETYDTISDMLMAATDVMVDGNAYLGSASAGVNGVFLVPDNLSGEYIKDAEGSAIKNSGGTTNVTVSGAESADCYDIADVKAYTDSSVSATDASTKITTNADGDICIYIRYASDLVAGDSVITYCSIKYCSSTNADKDKRNKIYILRETDSAYKGIFVDPSGSESNLLCKNVKDFYLQVNPDEGSFSINLDLEDSLTTESYNVNGVVKIRNSYVLKKHEWN